MAQRELPDARIIGLSMHDDKQLGDAMINAGVETFLSKFISTAELLKVICSISGERRTQR
jgi:DNA-binding NarL/FixJ family response regulator